MHPNEAIETSNNLYYSGWTRGTGGHANNRRARLDGLRAAQYDWDEIGLRAVLDVISAPDAVFEAGTYPSGI